RARVANRDALMLAILRQTQDVPVGKPGELGGELVALARGCRDRHREPGGKHPGDGALEPTEVIDIGDHALPRLAGDRCLHGNISGRHVYDLTGEFPPIREHVTAQQIDTDALKPASLVIEWEDVEELLQHGSGALFADPRSVCERG